MFREFNELREDKRYEKESEYERRMRLKKEEARELMWVVENMSLESLKALNESNR